MVLEAGYPFAAASGFRKVVKATILVKKKAGMSDEDFVQHYNHKHAQMAAPVLEKHHAITYSLTYCLARDRTIIADMLHGQAKMLDFDAICTFVFKDYRDFAKFMYDPASKALTPDHDNFMVEEEMCMMVGDEYMVIDEGRRVG
ncbi:EthD domain-containing protein [Neohortaea acidophila]|uniref:EthD domain-containing protein n=1 Tax=Neohortaea acidophila TaxID=245834 RepID=A0A6A6PUV4_9PEZI|nr:EthD domain-containing protein [Neohortaea acidophila]KAF2483223.1 EthD domain-containing protein [Neohortaea acidophila]